MREAPMSSDPSPIRYRGCTIQYSPKPIPARMGVDWDYYHDQWEPGAPFPAGHVATPQDAMREIDDWWYEENGHDAQQ